MWHEFFALNARDCPRSVRYYAIGQALLFALYFALLVGIIGLLAYFLDWIELELPLVGSFIVWTTVGVAVGFMNGLGTGYANNPELKNQHFIIIGSALLIAPVVLILLVYVVAPGDFGVTRDGVIATMLGTAFFGGLLACIAYGQKREVLKTLKKAPTD